MDEKQLFAEIDKLVDTGDQKALEKFLIDHYEDLPENMKGELLLSFYEESLQKEADEARVASMQQKGIAALEALSSMKEPKKEAE